MQSSTVNTILILGMAGVAGYFIYEYYIKKSAPANFSSLGSNSNGLNGMFESANNTVSSFLNSISGTGSNLLNSSGLLNTQGVNEANSILSNPLEFNNLVMQSDLNSLLNGNIGSSSSTSSSSSSSSQAKPVVFAPYVSTGASPDLMVGGGLT